MAIIETANTLSTFEKLKKDLFKIVGIFAILGMIIFSAYYVYLIVKNVEKTVYLVVYSVLFLVILASFFVEILLKNKEEDTRKERREVLEKKRLLKSIIKYPKYIAKTILVVLAIIETATDFDLGISNMFNILLAVWLVIQICIEIISHYVVNFLDELTLSIRRDKEQSFALKFLKTNINTRLEEVATAFDKEDNYTSQERKILKKVDARTKDYKEKREQEEARRRDRSISRITKVAKDKYEEGKEKLKKFFSKDHKEDKEDKEA